MSFLLSKQTNANLRFLSAVFIAFPALFFVYRQATAACPHIRPLNCVCKAQATYTTTGCGTTKESCPGSKEEPESANFGTTYSWCDSTEEGSGQLELCFSKSSCSWVAAAGTDGGSCKESLISESNAATNEQGVECADGECGPNG